MSRRVERFRLSTEIGGRVKNKGAGLDLPVAPSELVVFDHGGSVVNSVTHTFHYHKYRTFMPIVNAVTYKSRIYLILTI